MWAYLGRLIIRIAYLGRIIIRIYIYVCIYLDYVIIGVCAFGFIFICAYILVVLLLGFVFMGIKLDRIAIGYVCLDRIIFGICAYGRYIWSFGKLKYSSYCDLHLERGVGVRLRWRCVLRVFRMVLLS